MRDLLSLQKGAWLAGRAASVILNDIVTANPQGTPILYGATAENDPMPIPYVPSNGQDELSMIDTLLRRNPDVVVAGGAYNGVINLTPDAYSSIVVTVLDPASQADRLIFGFPYLRQPPRQFRVGTMRLLRAPDEATQQDLDLIAQAFWAGVDANPVDKGLWESSLDTAYLANEF